MSSGRDPAEPHDQAAQAEYAITATRLHITASWAE